MKVFNFLLFPFLYLQFNFIGAAIGAIGGLLAAKSSAKSAAKVAQTGADASVEATKLANAAQIASAREQMAFQEKMSNTAIRRQMSDLRAAGLNPILAAKYMGASSPTGAQATIQNAAPYISSAAQSAAQAQISAGQSMADTFRSIPGMIQADNSAKLIESQEAKVQQENLKIQEDIKSIPVARDLTREQQRVAATQVKRLKAEIKNIVEETRGKSQWNDIKKPFAEFIRESKAAEWMGGTGDTLDKISQSVLDYFKNYYDGIAKDIVKRAAGNAKSTVITIDKDASYYK